MLQAQSHGSFEGVLEGEWAPPGTGSQGTCEGCGGFQPQLLLAEPGSGTRAQSPPSPVAAQPARPRRGNPASAAARPQRLLRAPLPPAPLELPGGERSRAAVVGL